MIRRSLLGVFAAVLSAVVSAAVWGAPAAAQEGAPPPAATVAFPANPPRPFVMADLSPGRVMGAEFGYGTFANGQIHAYLIELVGEWEISPSLVVFGRVPFVYAEMPSGIFGSDDSGSALGNVSVGVRSFLSGADAHTRFGVSLQASAPTAPSLDLSDADALATLVAANLRITQDIGR